MRTLHVGRGFEGDRLCTLESKTLREFILYGTGKGHEINRVRQPPPRNSSAIYFSAYMVASVLLPTTSARIFYRKRKKGGEGFHSSEVLVGDWIRFSWQTMRTVDGPTRR
jgi:hypothetical protein